MCGRVNELEYRYYCSHNYKVHRVDFPLGFCPIAIRSRLSFVPEPADGASLVNFVSLLPGAQIKIKSGPGLLTRTSQYFSANRWRENTINNVMANTQFECEMCHPCVEIGLAVF